MQDNDLDNCIELYTESISTQFRKGLLSYMVLLIVEKPTYASEALDILGKTEVNVAEGTIYPLLSRLQRDGLLEYEWCESTSGPPRKYYRVTEYGRAVREKLGYNIKSLNMAIKSLERSKR